MKTDVDSNAITKTVYTKLFRVSEFHEDYNSYQIIIYSPYHKNEEINLLSKLEDACSNLIKHSKTENQYIINSVFVHIPESASIIKCKEWAEEYFLQFPQKPITNIILYQPSVAVDLSKDLNFIHHCFQFVTRMDKYEIWNPELSQIVFNLPAGNASIEPTKNKLIVEAKGETTILDFYDKYVYQRGNLYLKSKKEADGTFNGNIKRIASGIFSHSIFQPFPDQPSFMISGRFPIIDKLLII